MTKYIIILIFVYGVFNFFSEDINNLFKDDNESKYNKPKHTVQKKIVNGEVVYEQKYGDETVKYKEVEPYEIQSPKIKESIKTITDNRQEALKKVESYNKNNDILDRKKDYVDQKAIDEFRSKVENYLDSSKQKLIERFNDPGYVNSNFPNHESFRIAIKSPPPNANSYAQMVCKIAKTDYGMGGFVVSIWGFDKKKYGEFGCY